MSSGVKHWGFLRGNPALKRLRVVAWGALVLLAAVVSIMAGHTAWTRLLGAAEGALEAATRTPGAVAEALSPADAQAFGAVFVTDDMSTHLGGWSQHDSPDSLTGYADDEYRVLVHSPGQRTYGYPAARSPADYAVEVDARIASGTAGSYGIVFGLTDAGDYYAFLLDAQGKCALLRRLDGTDQWLAAWAPGPVVLKQGAVNRLRVERQGDHMRALVNGQLAASARDGHLVGDVRLGVIAASGAQPGFEARFDNWRVLVPRS